MRSGEPQHHIGYRVVRRGAGLPGAIQADIAVVTVADDHVAARGEQVPHRAEPHGQR
ncbi:hypothetical protein [Mycobacterium kubicae]|uniref:hypothetical protein n=1 Tax=Mycobacterium kubicae TaxID=120959 RepID=UPI0013F4E337|nr:hypothetical protein [Mycobacterium kubicae]